LDLIAGTYHDIGQQKLDAGLRSGQIWGNALASLGQIPGQIQQQKQQDLENQQRQQQLQIGQTQLAGLKAEQASQAAAQQVLSDPAVMNPDHTYNLPVLSQKLGAAGISPTVQANLLDTFGKLNTSFAKQHEDQLNADGDLANGALEGHDASNPLTKDEAQWYLAAAVTQGRATQAHIDPLLQQLANGTDPTQIFKTVKSFAPKYGGPAKFTAVGPNGVLNESTGQVIGGEPKAATAAEQEVDAQKLGTKDETPTSRYSAAAVAARAAAKKKEQDPTEFGTFKDASAKKLTANPDATWSDLTPDQQLAVIKQFKTLTTDESAAAAADRQTKTIQQQIAQQGRAQDFTESQAGRKELGDKIETPYRDAQEKADILRTVVQAAKNGNLEAAAVQKLLGTLGVVTTEGVKRINGTELEQVGGAGSLWDNIKSRAGKITAGQPLDPKLQDDLVQLAGLLEQSAYKKYSSGFDATTKRYKLTDEQKLPDPNAQFTHQPVPGHPGTFASSTDGGKTWKVDGGG
jgi:hypothetical protein